MTDFNFPYVPYLQMVKIMDEFLDDYNQVNTAQMKLVLFNDAVRHVCRIGRVIRQPLGNALLLGMGGQYVCLCSWCVSEENTRNLTFEALSYCLLLVEN